MRYWFKLTWNLTWLILRPLVSKKIQAVNADILEKIDRPVIFASNHFSIYDPWVIGSALPFNSKFFPIRFLAKHSFFTYKFLWFGYLLKWIFGAVAVRRKIGLENSLKKAIELFKNGYSLGIFPGGKISDNFEKKYRGIGYLHQQTKGKIVPIAISGKFSFLKLCDRNFIVKVFFGEPIYCPEKEIDEIVDVVTEKIIEMENNLK